MSNDSYIVYEFNKEGVLDKMLVEDHIFLFDNLDGYYSDIAILYPDKTIDFFRDVQSTISWNKSQEAKTTNLNKNTVIIKQLIWAVETSTRAAKCAISLLMVDISGFFDCASTYYTLTDIENANDSAFEDFATTFEDVEGPSILFCSTNNFAQYSVDCMESYMLTGLELLHDYYEKKEESIDDDILQCLEVETRCSIQVGIECEDLMISKEVYSETDNLDQKIIQEFGDSYSMADWNDIKNMSNLNDWISCMKISHDQTFMVKKDGSNFYGSDRQYYVHYSTDGVPYSGFAVHDRVGDFYLGSWYGLNMNVLAKKSDPNAQTFLEKYDGTKWIHTLPIDNHFIIRINDDINNPFSFWDNEGSDEGKGCYDFEDSSTEQLPLNSTSKIVENSENKFVFNYVDDEDNTTITYSIIDDVLKEVSETVYDGDYITYTWLYDKTSVNVNNLDLCDDDGNFFTTELFDLNNNQVPDGWQFETVKNADLSNGRMNAYPNDGAAIMIKVGEVSSSTQEIILEMDGYIAYSYWGLYSSFKITAGDKNLSFHSGEQDYEWPANQFANFVTYNDGQNGSRIYESLTPSIPGTYHFKLIMNSSGYELIGIDPNGEEAYRTKINSNDYFDFREIDKIEFLAISHTDNDAWIDNLRVTVN